MALITLGTRPSRLFIYEEESNWRVEWKQIRDRCRVRGMLRHKTLDRESGIFVPLLGGDLRLAGGEVG